MSRQAKISVMGLYQWNSDLFGLMVIPEGLDKDVVVSNLLAETAELEVLYPNYEVMRTLIGTWSYKELPIWEHLYNTTQYNYDPIQNYNRTEIETIEGEGDRTHSGTDTRTRQDITDSTSKEAIAGFDSVPSGNNDGLVDQSRNKYDNQFDSSDTLQHGEKINDKTNSRRENHTSGNIGVTTTQKMIREEREIAEFNIYDRIITDFKARFCIEVY